ncbi:hypothetical protein G9A89_007779 [Geosiphon pyriformis]|nr:hypothetical protein G9A89_007779 [Geosiphon pyriformis]
MTARINLATKLRKKLGIIATPGKLLPSTLNLCPLYKELHNKIFRSTKTFKYHIFCTSSTKVAFEYQVMDLLFNTTTEIITSFNFYVNKKISFLLGTPMNTESARETFYKELIQNINLPTNHNFASIITEINKEIEHHTQQKYPITYASKGKGKLQTPAVTPWKIQPPAWKKNRVESPSNPSYHYTPGSTINILSTDAFPSTVTLAFGQFLFQNFGISDLWEAAESEKEEEESKDQEFTYLHPITENPEQQLENLEIETPNIQMPPNQKNQNSELINQQNLPLVIVINQLLINPIAKPIQQSLQLSLQQPGQQQLLQQPPQPPNLDPMAYAPITKLDNFMGKEDNTQIWLNDIEKAIAANG